MLKTIIIIPARLHSERLPAKPLADIAGTPMIQRVVDCALAADLGAVFVATDAPEIADAVTGAQAVMTRGDHPSGTDRAMEAARAVDPDGAHEVILLVQGDVPLVAKKTLRTCVALLHDKDVAMGTVATEITDAYERDDPNVVKVVGSCIAPGCLRALYFSRATVPTGPGVLYHHIGIYAWRRQALEQFVNLPPSALEQRERLEQLRALEAGMQIRVGVVDDVPLSVDTPEDLARARARLRP